MKQPLQQEWRVNPTRDFTAQETEEEKRFYDSDLRTVCQEKCCEKGMKRAWKYLSVCTNKNLIK
jgi:hypothetical protein